MVVKTFLELDDFEIDYVNRIFFESSSKTHFKNQSAKEEFQYKYLDFYKIFFPQFFFILCGERPLGYVCGVPDLLKTHRLFELSPHLHAFKNLYKRYPGHLHINMSPESRGKGYGQELINKFVEAIKNAGGSGVHIITDPKAKNVSFYQKCEFNFSEKSIYKKSELLFMGKRLKS